MFSVYQTTSEINITLNFRTQLCYNMACFVSYIFHKIMFDYICISNLNIHIIIIVGTQSWP